MRLVYHLVPVPKQVGRLDLVAVHQDGARADTLLSASGHIRSSSRRSSDGRSSDGGGEG